MSSGFSPFLSALRTRIPARKLETGFQAAAFHSSFLAEMVRDSTETSEHWNGHIADFDNLRHVEELINQLVAGFRINQDQMSRENRFHLILLS